MTDHLPSTALDLEATLDACHAGAVVVTVNRRLARSLTARYERRRAAAGDAWWETPLILPLSRWLEALHDEALASGASLRARLSPLVAERRWQVLIEADRSLCLLAPMAAARQARRAWQLGHAWHVLSPAEGGSEEDDYPSLDQWHFRRWANAYAAQLDADELVDEATLPAHLFKLMADGEIMLPEHVVYAGFLSISPELRALCGTLHTVGVSLSRLADGPQATPRAVLYPDDAAELAGIADAIRLRLDQQPGAVLGVVVPDLDARRADVLRAFDRRFFPTSTPAEIDDTGRPYDLSLGRPLADEPVIRVALLALQLVYRGLTHHEASVLLLSPYLVEAHLECRQREKLDRRLREQRVQSLTLNEFRDRLDSQSALRRSLSKAGFLFQQQGVATAAIWAERFALCLSAFGWPTRSLDSLEFQTVQAWYGVLDDLQSLDGDEPLQLSDALSLIRRLAGERLFQPETPAVPIQVLGRLESHGQRFDALWIAGLDTERWPAPGSPSPFLPIERQKEAGMPEASSVTRLALAQDEFAHWCGAAPDVIASRAAERAGNALEAASVFGRPAEDAEASTLDFVMPAVGIHAAVSTEDVADSVGPPLAADELGRGGARLFQDQAECAFRSFAAHRLRIRALEEVTGGIDRREVGNVVHKALELFWKQTRTHAALIALSTEGLDQALVAAVDAALVAVDLDSRWRSLERKRLLPLLHEWMARAERPRQPFEVVAFEASGEIEHGGLRATLQIDRIDRLIEEGEASVVPASDATDATDKAATVILGEGRHVVLDYKTGTRETTGSWEDARIANPQLPLYALTDEHIVGVAYAQVAVRNCRFKGMGDEPGLLPGFPTDVSEEGWADRRAHWQAALDTVGHEFATGVAAILPAPKACTYCDMRALCRIDEIEARLLDNEVSPGPGDET